MLSNSYNFKEKLYYMLDDLDKLSTKKNILAECINEKLNASLKNYMKEVDNLCKKILNKNTYRVLKASSNILNSED